VLFLFQHHDPEWINAHFKWHWQLERCILWMWLSWVKYDPIYSYFSALRDLVRVLNDIAGNELVQPSDSIILHFFNMDRATSSSVVPLSNYCVNELCISFIERYWDTCKNKDTLIMRIDMLFWKKFLVLLMKDGKYCRILLVMLMNSCEGLSRNNRGAYMLCVFLHLGIHSDEWAFWSKHMLHFGLVWSWFHNCEKDIE
jgi:hypothetical protein